MPVSSVTVVAEHHPEPAIARTVAAHAGVVAGAIRSGAAGSAHRPRTSHQQPGGEVDLRVAPDAALTQLVEEGLALRLAANQPQVRAEPAIIETLLLALDAGRVHARHQPRGLLRVVLRVARGGVRIRTEGIA